MKSILKSRTFWLAVAQAVLGISIAVAMELESVGTVLVLKSLLDIILRLDTTDPIK